MANTVIQLKYSTLTATPTSLNIGEPAYSYTSNTFFIGSPDGTGSIAIGGKFYLDQQQSIYDLTNAAFAQANSAGSSALVQYAAAHANAAFDSANTNAGNITVIQGVDVTQNTNITTAQNAADAAFLAANGAIAVNLTQNTNITTAQNAADAAFEAANGSIAVNTTQNNSITAAFAAANTAQDRATAAFIRANNSIDANNGGTITGSLTVTGNLTVQGNTTYVDTEILTVQDSLIKLANNNTADSLDIGFYGQYNDGADKFTGLARGAASDNFFLFKGLTQDPASNTLASGSITAANAATLIANVSAYKVTIGGQDIQIYADNAYAAANGAQASADAAFLVANNNTGINATQNTNITAAQNTADAAFLVANNNTGINATQNTNITTAQNTGDAAFLAANNAQTHANYAFNHANAAFDTANTDVTNISITAADYGTASETVAFRVEANGRISSANSTSIAIAASQITSGTLGVTRGGTGATTFTTNGVLLGNGTSPLSTASSSTEGHVLTINASGVPTFAMLQGGTF